ncbi:inorganic diphosphatase [Deinococcus arcticus]|uniref:inorganic diphosphatase n=1 Tax=Deinococcus arcticus TaxID=2136176 RepID=A0A2T3WBA1_9DEIO|nr:inorganic diphosphatase [Deinococcus arcticus]PTA69112.1 inorganic pyrophosphatase [Deinococcus arcticus]
MRDLRAYLGQRVRVVVDRPLGSVHPRHPDLRYPVNYGELPGTLGGDGQPVDAYLLGWDTAVPEAEGEVIAVIERLNDAEDKLVVARDGTDWSDDAIGTIIRFQEQYFHTRLVRAQGAAVRSGA